METRPNETAPFQIARISPAPSTGSEQDVIPSKPTRGVRRRSIVGAMPGTPLRPMLAVAAALPEGPQWAYEFKWDGIRALADIRGGRQRLYARSGTEITVAYPELAPLAQQVGDALLDGEVVRLGESGQPSFTALAERMHVRDPHRAAQLAASVPVTYMIFDVMRLDGADLTGRPYRSRREALEALGLGGARWAVPPVFADGAATYEAAGENGLEGVVAKRWSRFTGRGCVRRTG